MVNHPLSLSYRKLCDIDADCVDPFSKLIIAMEWLFVKSLY